MNEEELKFYLVLADSYLSWALHRYSDKWPEDFKKDVNDWIGAVRSQT